MEQETTPVYELNLSKYLAVLRRRWPIVAGIAGLTLIGAVAYSLLRPVGYTVEATLLAQAPKYVWALDYNFRALADDLRYDRRNDYNLLVTERAPGLQLAQKVIDKMGDALPARLRSPEALWKRVTVKNDTGRLITLTVRAPSAELAQALASAWAEVWIAEAEARYGQVSDRAGFEAASEQANLRLEAATQATQEFQSRTGLALELGSQLASLSEGRVVGGLTALQERLVLKSSALADYQAALDQIRQLKARAEQARAEGTPFTALPLEILETPLLVQRGQLTRQRVELMNGDLDQLLQALAVEETSTSESIKSLQSETDALQAQLANQMQERNRLQREYSLADEAAKALERKITEIEIQESIAGPQLALLGPAGPPKAPTARLIATLGAALVLGVLGGIALAIAVDLARQRAG